MFRSATRVEVKVLKFDPETERVSAWASSRSRKIRGTTPRPLPGRQPVAGKVVSLTDYGAFVELEPGIEGLIHVSEMSWTKRVKHPSKLSPSATGRVRSSSTSTRRTSASASA
jgi:small subunit ribosomal protein S1